MGKYIPVQTNHGVTGDILIHISDETVPGLILTESVYNVKKKLGCIFKEIHNRFTILLKRGQTIGLVTSCVLTQAEQGQLLEKRKEDTHHVIGQNKDKKTCIGGASVWERGESRLESRQCTVYRKKTVLQNRRREP